MNSNEMYREHILDLYKNPRNFGDLENPDLEVKESNSSCGDEITLKLKIKNNKVEDVKFSGVGCTIAIASTSLLTEEIKGKTLEELKLIDKEKLLSLLEIPISPPRLKCALLPLEAIKKIK